MFNPDDLMSLLGGGASTAQQKPQPFAISANSKLSVEAFSALKAMAETHLKYNEMIYQYYLSCPREEIRELNDSLWDFIDEATLNKKQSKFTAHAKQMFKEDSEYFRALLLRLTTSQDPQRELDDAYEFMRYELSIAELGISAFIPAEEQKRIKECTLIKVSIDSKRDILETLKPFISDFQKDFERFNPLVTSNGRQAAYESNLHGFCAELRDKLQTILGYYKEQDGASQLMADIQNKQALLNPLNFMLEIPKYARNKRTGIQDDSLLELTRGAFYFLSHVLRDAKKKWVLFKLEAAKNKAEAEEKAKRERENTAQRATAVPAAPAPATPAAPPAKSNATPSDVGPNVLPVEEPSSPRTPLPAAAPEPVLVHSDLRARPVARPRVAKTAPMATAAAVLPAALLRNEAKRAADIPGSVQQHPNLAQVMRNRDHKDTLEALFSGPLSKVKITSTQIEQLFTALGCEWRSNGVRITFSYQGRMGFSGNYHIKSPDNRHGKRENLPLHPVALSHVKSFLSDIGASPKALMQSCSPSHARG